jgi:hypothetical protein
MQRSATEVALHHIAAKPDERVFFGLVFYSFGSDHQAHAVTHLDHGLTNCCEPGEASTTLARAAGA